MITTYCTCGHALHRHGVALDANGTPVHSLPCREAECLCQRFKLNRRATRYETEQERLRANRDRDVFA